MRYSLSSHVVQPQYLADNLRLGSDKFTDTLISVHGQPWHHSIIRRCTPSISTGCTLLSPVVNHIVISRGITGNNHMMNAGVSTLLIQ